MQKIKKVFKWSFNYIRLLLLKLEYGKRIKFGINGLSHPPYIAWKAKINVDKGAQLVLKNGSYISSYCQILLSKDANVQINNGVYIGEFSRVVCRNKIILGKNSLLANNVSIYDHDHCFGDLYKPIADQGFISGDIKVGDNCWLGTNVVVLRNTTIQKNSIVGANAVISGSNTVSGVYVGRQAKLKKKL